MPKNYVKVSRTTLARLKQLKLDLQTIDGEFHSFDRVIERLLSDTKLKYQETLEIMRSKI